MQPYQDTNAAIPAEAPEEKKKNPVVKELISWALHLGITAAIMLLVGAFVFQIVRVDGNSMQDTLQHNDWMLVTKYDYLFGQPEAGDVVVCQFPGERNEGKLFVKRIVGAPGDVIAFRDGQLYRNGEAVEESYLTPSRNQGGYTMEPMELGEGEYFVCGDNRDNSHDSRTLITWNPEPIPRKMIKGHVRRVVFPFANWKPVP